MTNVHLERRKILRDHIGADAVAIVLAAPERARSRDTLHPYRQDSDFYYLTGFSEPEAAAVFAPGRKQGEYLLFCRPRDPAKEIWDGRRAGPEGAVRDYGADQAFNIAELSKILPELLGSRRRVYYTLGSRKSFDRRLAGWLNTLKSQSRRGVNAPPELIALDSLLHELRLIKDADELALMRRAAEISAQAHRRAMQACRPGRYEYQLAAEIRHEFETNGATPAYSSIVGGGANACILHYVENSASLREAELVLVDAGAEYQNYCADITRSYPVSGKFSGPQRALYEVVLAAQAAAIEQIRVGKHWNQPHEAAVRALTEGLVALGLLQGDVSELIASESYKRFYMHSTSHWLGMDVHDVGAYKLNGEWRELVPGMVLTVEPGLYVAPDAEGVDERFRGIGIRIEDDVHVAENGPELLTVAAPKAIAEIEALMRR
ncbi:MAG: Xaa-Pro aminopeptidase [Nevskiales bacterium]